MTARLRPIEAVTAPAAAVPERRGACPALDAPMQTGDGLLLRLSPATGGVSPNQLSALCDSALRHGNGTVEVTARGSFQFRGFDDETAARFAEDVAEAGIAVRTGVPVDISPLAGQDPAEIANPRPIANAIRDGIASRGLRTRLAPKISVVVDGGGRISLDTLVADVRLKAVRIDGEVAWALAIGGDAAHAVPLGHHDATTAISVALAILAKIAFLGPQARGRDLAPNDQDAAPGPASSPDTQANAEPTAMDAWRYPLSDRRVALRIALPFGSTTAETLSRWAQEAQARGVTDIRPAPLRGLLAICPGNASSLGLRAVAANLGFITGDDVRTAIAACPGAPACAAGRIATRAVAEEAARLLAGHASTLPAIHVSGCAKGCARPAAAAITVVGVESGGALVVDGTTRATPVAYTNSEELASAIAATVRAYQRETPADGGGLPAAAHARIAAAFEERDR